jgi:RNA polymerase sigma factor (sigma-70 family)
MKLVMDMSLRINAIFREYHKEIKNGTYEWKDEEVECIYQYVNKFIDNNDMKVDGYTRDDLTQELVLEFFEAAKRYNVNNVHSLSIYLKRAFTQRCHRLQKNQELVELVSFNTLDNIVVESDFDREINIRKKEIADRFVEINKTNKYALDYFFSDKDTLEAVGKSYGVTRERVRQCVDLALNRARKDIEITKIITR